MPPGPLDAEKRPGNQPGNPDPALGPADGIQAASALDRPHRTERVDLATWLVLVLAGLGLTWLAVRAGARLGTSAAPFVGRYRLRIGAASVLAPAVAAATIFAVVRRWHERVRWPVLLLAGYAVSAAWALALAVVDGGGGLAGPVSDPNEYLADVPRIGHDPGAFLSTFVAHGPQLTAATRQHPPLPVLLLWAAGRAGLHRPAAIGIAITLVGALVTPLVAIAMRSLSGELAARRLAPVLALAPYAIWLAVSMDAITAALGAAFVACGVLASERGRPALSRLLWAAVCGLLIGTAALFSYSVAWLGVSVLCVYFVRRRPLLPAASGACALVPLLAARLAGFSWSSGLALAQRDLSQRVGPQRSALVWGLLGVVILLLAGGPALVASARRIRLTPGWPFLVGAALGVSFALLSGLARGEAERSWLPFFPWLTIAAVAPDRRGPDTGRTPTIVVAVGAVTAIAIQAVLRSPW